MPLYRRPGSPHWWVRIGRHTRKSTGTEDREQAEEFERVLTERLWRIQKLGDRGAVAWSEAAAKWLASSKRPRKRDREILLWLAPKVGHYSVSHIAHADVIEQLRQHSLSEGWSFATTDRVMGTISAVLRSTGESVPRVPMYRAPIPEPRWLTPEQFEDLCEELPKHLALAAKFAVYTMLRMRAMLSLTWDRVDLEKKRAWIPGTQMKGRLSHGIPLSPEAISVLRALKKLNPTGANVFQWKGKPIDDCNTAAFQKAVERAGVGPLRWHDLRHTGASWASQSGVTLQELMGLGSWKSFASVQRYSHLSPDHLAKAANLVGRMSHTGKKRKRA